MENLPNDWWALLLLVFTLGMRHGIDADHLATVDGLTRHNAGRRIARWCGVLFSLGHGAVVIAVALAVAFAARTWSVPAWMEDLGSAISIAFLTLLGLLNLHAVLHARPGEIVRPVGFKGRLFARLQRIDHPLLILLVGSLFALSFDTLSQAALFSIAAGGYGGGHHCAALGLAFMLGMMLTDGINGLWISRLLRRADRLACIASRVMGLAVAALSLAIAAFGLARYISPDVGAWSDGKELLIGACVTGALGLSFILALCLARPAPAGA